MLFFLLFFSFFILSSSTQKLNKLLKLAETKDLYESTKAFQSLFDKKYDLKDPTRFKKIQERISSLLLQELILAQTFTNSQKFLEASKIYYKLLTTISTILDEKNLKYIIEQNIETHYRLALGGNYQWEQLEIFLKEVSNRNHYQNYLLRLTQMNIKNKNSNWKPKSNNYNEKEKNLPYVIRYFTPQKYHTPTLAHFGHV